MAKILCVLYPDPVGGYPPKYARDTIPALRGYPDGQTLPTPEAIDFIPGQLLGCVSGDAARRSIGPRRSIEAHCFLEAAEPILLEARADRPAHRTMNGQEIHRRDESSPMDR